MHPNVKLACDLARNNHWPVFPVRADKTPATPHGYLDASTDVERILELWDEYPGELIGLATGFRSGVDVLDLDTYRAPALAWWMRHSDRIPPTRAFRTRRGGQHLYYKHLPGLRNSQDSRIATGIDVRGNGGYVVHWYAAGCECLDHSPIAPWPTWLAALARPPVREPPPAPPTDAPQPSADQQAKRAAALIKNRLAAVQDAPDGTRHDTLLRAARTVGGLIAQAGMTRSDAAHRLYEALKRNVSRASIRDWSCALRTISDGLDDGIENPMTLTERPYDRSAAA